jgi:hypothetical protein
VISSKQALHKKINGTCMVRVAMEHPADLDALLGGKA